MTIYYARKEYIYEGGDAVFSIPFPYIKKNHINVLINGERTENYTFLNSTQIRVTQILDVKASIIIARTTPIDEKMVNFSNTSILDKDVQNLAQDQVFNTVQEIYDNNIVFQEETNETLAGNKADLEGIIEKNKQEVLGIQSNFETEVNNKIQQVSDAANKINKLEEAVNTAVDSATIAAQKADKASEEVNKAKEQADIATQKATEATDIVNNSLTSIENKTQEELNKIHATGIDTKLNKTQLTNCILEVPQRIKWEVIDGVFYIKAGSVLTRPNGWIDKEQGIRKFEYKTLDTNIALSQITNKNTANVILFFVGAKQSGNEGLWYFDNEINVFSQDTPPAVSIAANMWYDTDNNIIKYTTDSGKTWIDEEIYFPIGLVSLRNGVLDSVVDIFNGSGFIGSCGWVDRGVKCLFSNGSNDNGSLKNVENSTSEISISNPTGYKNAVSHMLLELNQDNSLTLGWLLHVYEGYVLPPIVSSDNEYFYHKTENIWYYHAVGETKWKISDKQNIILRKCWFNENNLICTSTINTPVSLAKEQDIDGKYTTSTMYLVQNATLTKDYNKTFDLSNYLPDDNHPYLVLVDVILRTGSAINNSFGLYAKSNLISNAGCLCRAVTRIDKVNAISGCTTFIPVGSDHTISLLAGDESNASTFANSTSISLNGFRRIR